MKKNLLIPGLAVTAGILGFFLRKWELATAFEPDTNLPRPGMPATLALGLLSIALFAALIFLCIREKKEEPYDSAFRAEGNTVYAVLSVLSSFFLLASAGAEIVTYPFTYQSALLSANASERPLSPLPFLLPILQIVLNLLGFVCVLLIMRNLYGAKGNGHEHLPLLGLCALFCIWLISDYQIRSTNPTIQDYLYELLAISASLLALYEIATYSFQKGHARRTLIFSLMGTYFSLVTLADSHTLAELFRYGFVILFLTTHAALLLGEHPAGEHPPATETEAAPHA